MASLLGGELCAQQIRPREPLPKGGLALFDSRTPHRLVVKFRDEVKARASAEGRPVSIGGLDLSGVRQAMDKLGLTARAYFSLPDEELQRLERRAEKYSRVSQPDLGGMLAMESPEDSNDFLFRAGEILEMFEEVEFASLEPLDPRPLDDIEPPTPDYFPDQYYVGEAPGMAFQYAWLMNSFGHGIRLFDIEFDWDLAHEDLADVSIVREHGHTPLPPDPTDINHGTAVVGLVVATWYPAYGILGLAPGAEVHVHPVRSLEWPGNDHYRGADPIVTAAAAADFGDVILIEVGPRIGAKQYPWEVQRPVFLAIKTATDAGVIVVEAAGNGGNDLDDPTDGTANLWRTWGDSGAIIVGAGAPFAAGYPRMLSSTYGSRLNVQGWGSNIRTTYGKYGGDPLCVPTTKWCEYEHQGYRLTFGGTSGASALVASACLLIQKYAEDRLCRRLGPTELRGLLEETGLPHDPILGWIGPRAYVKNAIDAIASQYLSECLFRRADVDEDLCVDIGDAVAILAYLFESQPMECEKAADVNDDGSVDIADPADLFAYLFGGGPAPSEPFLSCGFDDEPDGIRCRFPYDLGFECP